MVKVMLISDIMNREYKLCEFDEREKSVLYRLVDLDDLLLEDANIDEDNILEIVDPDIAGKLI
ncbi:hypothetical protein UF10_03140 [Peptostreptococcus russellii]|uniref:Uncharacterized protein n=2 Tax=Peptostreptococcus russellii TaxID=215200 RepID=A0A2P7Q108_9FIRM|nr:hypothetical protein UF10_03140 [Peptostreptococcus russellii]